MWFKFESGEQALRVLLYGCVFCASTAASQQARHNADVYLLVFDDGRVPSAVMEAGKVEATRILREAGVALIWVNCSAHFPADKPTCRNLDARNAFVLHIIAKGKTSSDSVFGEAFMGEDGNGKYADIFYDRVESAHQAGADTSRLLGAVAAHELGHLLLGAHAHAWTGIMAPVWEKAGLRHVNKGDFLFSREQAARMNLRIRGDDVTVAKWHAKVD
jgi:hypothetical protein